MPKPQTTVYTLVQHSGYSVGRDPDFKNAVELQGIPERQTATVEKVGGVIFATYTEARDREYEENYPDDRGGIIPRARGSFVSRAAIGKIYIPQNKASAA